MLKSVKCFNNYKNTRSEKTSKQKYECKNVNFLCVLNDKYFFEIEAAPRLLRVLLDNYKQTYRTLCYTVMYCICTVYIHCKIQIQVHIVNGSTVFYRYLFKLTIR